MYKRSLIFTLLLIITAPLYAEVYKCVDDGNVRYSTTPCDSQLIDLAIDDEMIEEELDQEERFVTPVYSGWPQGWKKSKDLKLERFFEVIYEPTVSDQNNKDTHINHQRLTNLPQSMTVERFAISVEDIIESICANAVITQPKMAYEVPENIFYGKYACSLRRDTKKGELGYYKIIRGESSIYMIAIKWAVEAFEIESGASSIPLFNKISKKERNTAEQYLQKKVKLCHEGKCI